MAEVAGSAQPAKAMSTNFFKKLINPGGESSVQSGAPRLVLAAFGKHPGWNDHIPGLGMETETLANLKQSLYVTGIGGRIDSGAWKALDAEKRLEGFDHIFLSLRDGHVITGRMFSSEDGLHRREYPMVLCVDSEGMSTGFIFPKALSELDRLRDMCKATSSAEQVATECRMAQDRLRELLADPLQQMTSATIPVEARSQFLDHCDLGPDRVGLLRALHELGVTGDATRKGTSGKVANGISHHLRLPLAADSRNGSLLLWAEFFRCAVSASLPLLLIARAGVDWLDVIIGEPVSDDLFCLQASPKALPLASQIPYELTPELKPRLQELQTKFLEIKSPQVMTGLGTRPASGQVGTIVDAAPASKSKGLGILPIVGGVVLVAGVGVWLLMTRRGSPPEAKPVVIATNPEQSKVAVVVTSQPAAQIKTNDAVREAARIKSEAETKQLAEEKRIEEAKVKAEQQARQANRLAEEKKVADARAAEEARLKKSAAEKIVTNATTPVETKNVEDAKAQALAMETDVNLARTALAQGNYERVTEICQKWPGVEQFQQLAQTIAVETNQLRQVKELLQVGNYAAILTNRLPDKARFKEVLTSAVAEKKILDQASEEFAKGDYAFLQRAEVLDLQAKPPFQKLLQAGGAEADQLKQAQQLQSSNQPQMTMDFVSKVKSQKQPFVKIQKWAEGELERIAREQGDSQSAKSLFDKAEYGAALELCGKYSGIAAFDVLARSIGEEQKALAADKQALADGDYSFISELEGRGYKTKKPFADLLSNARLEQRALLQLSAFTNQANGWAVLRGELNKQSAGVVAKRPFAVLDQWAQKMAREDEERKKVDPSWLDDRLEVLLVQFKVLKASDSRIKTLAARQAKTIDGALDLSGQAYFLEIINKLETEYKKGGWLDKGERGKFIKEIRDRINYGN